MLSITPRLRSSCPLPAATQTVCPAAPLTNSQGVEGDQQRHHLQAPASPSQACISHGQAITAGCLMTCCCWWLLGSAGGVGLA